MTNVTQSSSTSSLILSGVNTYTGGTTLSAGILRATTNASALGTGIISISGGTLELASATSAGLDFGNNTIITGNTIVQSDLIAKGAGLTQTMGTLSIGADTLYVNAGGNVTSGTAGITFGTTTLTATGATFTTYTGTQLTLGAISDGGHGYNFIVNGAGNTSITGNITTEGGTVTQSGTGTLTLSGTNTYTGGTTVSSGITQHSKQQCIEANTASVTSGATLQLEAGISFSNALTLNGTGYSSDEGALENVSGSNTYTGAIHLAAPHGSTLILEAV